MNSAVHLLTGQRDAGLARRNSFRGRPATQMSTPPHPLRARPAPRYQSGATGPYQKRREKKSVAAAQHQARSPTGSHSVELSPGWSLGADALQWIVYRRRKRREETYWQPVSFVGSTKKELLRVLRERGVRLTPVAEVILAGMPEQFGDYLTKGNHHG